MGMGTGLKIYIYICIYIYIYLYLSYLWRRQRHNSWPSGRHSMSSGKAWHLPKTYNIYCCHNFFNQWFRDFIQFILFKKRVVFRPCIFAIAWRPLRCFFMAVSIHTITIFFTKRSGCPSVQVSPEPCSFSVIKAILTIVSIKVWQVLHKLLLLQKPPLGIFYHPYSRVKVVDYLCFAHQRF